MARLRVVEHDRDDPRTVFITALRERLEYRHMVESGRDHGDFHPPYERMLATLDAGRPITVPAFMVPADMRPDDTGGALLVYPDGAVTRRDT